MAKGQKRGNREAKKPKQAKPKAVAASTTLAGRLAPQAVNGAARRK